MVHVPPGDAYRVYSQLLELESGNSVRAEWQIPLDHLLPNASAVHREEFRKQCAVEERGHAGADVFKFFPSKVARHCWSHLVRLWLA